jgi:hypothetical protein
MLTFYAEKKSQTKRQDKRFVMQLKFDRASENPKYNQIKESVVGNVLARHQRPGCDLFGIDMPCN